MLANLSTTQMLAALIGLYFVSAGTGLLVERQNMSTMFKELSSQSMLGYLGGIIAFSVGAVIVAIHNEWSGLLAGFVTLVGWMALGEGVLMLAFRRWFLGLFEGWLLSPTIVSIFGIGTVLGGLVLLYAGLGA